MASVGMISLGCEKNRVDAEMMMARLQKAGYELVDDASCADVAIVNTCGFIEAAKKESIGEILELGKQKAAGQIKVIVVTGCMAERYQQEIRKELPEADAVCGIGADADIVEVVDRTLRGEHPELFPEKTLLPLCGERVHSTPLYSSYIKIAEGCDKRCTYCIIPKVRGGYRSVPMEALVKEAEELAEGGVRELILVAQETTVYGKDLYGRKALPELLEKLCRIPGLYWIRLLYCYPEEITPELIDCIRREPKICHYLDMPIQHAADGILKKMGRRTNQEELRERIAQIREAIPDICLRTTLISGFPGETQEDFEELYNFVDEMEFDRLGVFPYSREEGTPAAEMPDQVPQEIKESRRDELMELQQEIAFEKAESMKGRTILAMIEGKVEDENAYVARTYMDAPGVDGLLFINTSRQLLTGDFVRARVTGSYEYDLIGELEDEFTE